MTESEKTYKDYKNLFNKLVQEAKNNFYIKNYQNVKEIPRHHGK